MSIDKAKKIDRVKLGKRIRKLRESKGLTIKGFAAKIGVSREVISNIENGRSEPRIPDFIKILNELEIGADMLCYDFIKKDRNFIEHKIAKNIKEISSVAPKIAAKLHNLLEW